MATAAFCLRYLLCRRASSRAHTRIAHLLTLLPPAACRAAGGTNRQSSPCHAARSAMARFTRLLRDGGWLSHCVPCCVTCVNRCAQILSSPPRQRGARASLRARVLLRRRASMAALYAPRSASSRTYRAAAFCCIGRQMGGGRTGVCSYSWRASASLQRRTTRLYISRAGRIFSVVKWRDGWVRQFRSRMPLPPS